MLIDDIKPYERTARNNEKAIPIVAESIKEFGLRGQICLRSHEDPTIVTGHTRWAACKSLGWTEIPDSNIDFCDDLTDEQVKQYRLADNRTGEVATWNKALLKSEIKALDKAGVDMSRFSFDFKSKVKPVGAERLRTDEHYNLDIVNRLHCSGRYDMPTLEPCDFVPSALLPFNYAKTATDFDTAIHFFKDDYQFERLWNKPAQYLKLLSQFECLLTPDFSLYMDMPLPMQQWNIYRSRALGNYWQRNGLNVIPTLSWSDRRSYGFCFDGLPKHSTYAVSTVGVREDDFTMKVWRDGMDEALKRLEPDRLILYGGVSDYEFPCEVIGYKDSILRTDKQPA